MTAIQALNDRLLRETVEYRKGDEVTTQRLGDMEVVHVYAMPPAPERGELVDLHFIKVGFTEAAADREGFVDLVEKACTEDGYYATIDINKLRAGPSYIELGAWLGSQDQALRLIALAKHYGIAEAITPAILGITGEEADKFAGGGMVMLSGWAP